MKDRNLSRVPQIRATQRYTVDQQGVWSCLLPIHRLHVWFALGQNASSKAQPLDTVDRVVRWGAIVTCVVALLEFRGNVLNITRHDRYIIFAEFADLAERNADSWPQGSPLADAG